MSLKQAMKHVTSGAGRAIKGFADVWQIRAVFAEHWQIHWPRPKRVLPNIGKIKGNLPNIGKVLAGEAPGAGTGVDVVHLDESFNTHCKGI